MENRFLVDHLDVERLLAEWRWLCPQPMALVARNSFGDLFLRDQEDRVFKLDVAAGRMTRIAESMKEFCEQGRTEKRREEWFLESDELAAAKRGLTPNRDQCIGFKTPLVFAESGSLGDAFVADLYEQVSFLGTLHRQISELPDGAQVRFEIDK